MGMDWVLLYGAQMEISWGHFHASRGMQLHNMEGWLPISERKTAQAGLWQEEILCSTFLGHSGHFITA